MEAKPPAITDNIRWLLENEDQRLLFLAVEKAGLIKGPVNQRMRRLIDRGLVENCVDGLRLSEHGYRVLEGFEALRFLGEI